VSDDLQDMACAEWIAAISADVDGEDLGVDPRLLAAHLESCPSCRTYRDEVRGLRRVTAVGAAPQMPDLAREVSRRNAVTDRASRSWVVRLLLALTAGVILVSALPHLLGHGGESVHESRHVGAFSVAYAVALLLVVLRPARARAIFPVTLVLAGALLITAAIDVIEGHIPLVSETAHIPELLSVALVWLLARPLPDPTGRVGAASPEGPGLRLLADDEPHDGPERATG
jgi:RNA polymerase sigma-70 factor (ECF subfamily)